MKNQEERQRSSAVRRGFVPVLLGAMFVAASCTSATPVGDSGSATTGDSTEAVTATTEAAGDAQRGGELTVGIVSESNSWYPPEAEWAFSAGNLVADAFYENLYMQAGDGTILPVLADGPAVSNDDATEWTVTLRPGITFHDGTPLDADALVDMSVLWNEGRFATPGEGIDQTIKVDDMTVTYTLFEPDPVFESTLAGNRGVAFSPSAARGYGDAAAENPVGTGPFVFQSWTRDSQVVTTRNPNYWQEGQPYLDQITFRVLTDGNSRLASLESGDIDLATQGGIDGLAPLIEKGYLYHAYTGSGAGAIIFNTLNPPMDDKRVRRAVSYAIDPEDLNAINPGNLEGTLAKKSQFYSSKSPWYNPAAEDVYPYFDMPQAQALVEEYKNDPARSDGKAVGEPLAFQYVCTSTPTNRLTSQLFIQAWDDAGFEIDFLEEEQGTMVTRVVGAPTQDPAFLGDFQATCWAEGNDGDPLPLYDTRFGDVASNVLNFTNYTNPDVDAQIDILRSELDPEARYDAAAEIAMILADELPILWQRDGGTTVIFNEKVKSVNNFTWPDGTPGNTMDRGRVMWQEVWIDGAEPLDISTGLIEPPAAPAPTTTAPPEEAGGGDVVANDAILAALPGADILPAGVADSVASDETEQCPGASPRDGLSPTSITAKSFSGGDFGPFIGTMVYEFPAGEAEQYMASYAENAVGPCVSYNTTTSTGAPLSQATVVIDGKSYGDATGRYTIRGETGGFPVNTELVLIRSGDRLIRAWWIAVGGDPDPAMFMAFVDAVDAAVASAN